MFLQPSTLSKGIRMLRKLCGKWKLCAYIKGLNSLKKMQVWKALQLILQGTKIDHYIHTFWCPLKAYASSSLSNYLFKKKKNRSNMQDQTNSRIKPLFSSFLNSNARNSKNERDFTTLWLRLLQCFIIQTIKKLLFFFSRNECTSTYLQFHQD